MGFSDSVGGLGELLRLKIGGMTCSSCSASIERELRKKPGVIEASVFILSHTGVIRFNPDICKPFEILKIIENLGFSAVLDSNPGFVAAPSFQGLQKPGAFKPLASPLKPPSQVVSMPLSPVAKPLESTFSAPSNPEPIDKESTKSPSKSLFLKINDFIESRLLTSSVRLVLSLLGSLIAILLAMAPSLWPPSLQIPWLNGLAQLFVTLCVMHLSRPLYIKGLKALKALRPNMDSLVSLGSLSGLVFSFYNLVLIAIGIEGMLYFESVCVILSLVMLGRRIEEWAKNRALDKAQGLLSKQSKTARRVLNPAFLESKNDIQVEEVGIERIEVGDFLQVLPHSLIPVDSKLVSPKASLDESLLSGESRPLAKQKGDFLAAGSLNLDSPLLAQAVSRVEESTLARIQNMVLQAQESKAAISSLVDRISGFFVPIVILLASLSGIFWFFEASLEQALLHFASTLLISCPCALGLATPMALLFANARANGRGIFFRDAKSLEALARLDSVLFDKTGTLTDGALSVIELRPAPTLRPDLSQASREEELLRICASIETTSNHPIAKSLLEAAKNLKLYKVLSSKSVLGGGLEASLEMDSIPRSFVLGSHSYLKTLGLSVSEEGLYLAEKSEDGYAIVGSLILGERLKADAKRLIDSLKAAGIHCEILSGDASGRVALIANALDIPYKAGCLPEDKKARVEELQKAGGRVLMVGDGANDSIALAKANLSLVMASGSEVSVQQANIIYFSKGLLDLVLALDLGRATLRVIKQNLAFAFVYNVVCIPIAMGVFSPTLTLTPLVASIAMSLSSLSVIASASRLSFMRLGVEVANGMESKSGSKKAAAR